MWPNDGLSLAVNFGYIGLVLWIGDEVRRHLHLNRGSAQRIIQLLLALFVVPTLTFFSSSFWSVVAPLVLALFVFLACRPRGSFATNSLARRTVFMLLAYALLVVVFWWPEWRYVAASSLLAGVLALEARDAVDERAKRDTFVFQGEKHSLAGLLTAVLTFGVGLAVALFWLSPLPIATIAGMSVLLAVVVSLVGLVSVRQTGEFVVPVVSAILLFALARGGVQVGALMRLLGGIGVSAVIGVAGLATGALSPSGVGGAVLVGTFIFGFGGFAWAIPMVVFFIAASWLSHRRRPKAEDPAARLTGRTARRSLSQTLANGGVGAAVAALKAFAVAPAALLYCAYLGSVAAANADTWATEIGTRSEAKAWHIISWQEVPRGTSGAVTGPGTLASLAGAVLIGLVGAVSFGLLSGQWSSGYKLMGAMAVSTAVGGFLGAFLDSLVGATLQGTFRCPACGQVGERRIDECGCPAELVKGLAWLDNDWVNFLATLGGAVAGALTFLLLGAG